MGACGSRRGLPWYKEDRETNHSEKAKGMPQSKISIQKGLSNEEDKKGNDKSDELVDEGVESIQGRGLVKLASWIADRHDKYGSFMKGCIR